MRLNWLGRAEWAGAILLTAVVLVLLFMRAQHAGGLWRDECAVVQLAEMPSMADVLKNFQRETFPAIFPLTVRAYAAAFGTSDAAFRVFGFAVGALLLVGAWLNARILANGPPLISLALLGLNATFLIWGTSIRAYGLGSIAILLAFGLISKMLVEPSRSRIAVASFAALISVQFLLHNAVLLVPIAVAVATVCIIRRKAKPAIVLAATGFVCGLSILPYVGPFLNESRATIVFRGPIDLGWLAEQFGLALGNSVMIVLWTVLFVAVIAWTLRRLYITWSNKPSPEWDLLLFGLVVLVSSPIFYFAFLRVLSYRTREWYYLVLLSILAGAIDLLVANLVRAKWARITRLFVIIAVLIGLPFSIWPKVIERQTNVDLVAQKLNEIARPGDLIVANPWYLGIPFNWYYHGTTPWATCPTMDDHRVHRFDLLKEKMISSTPIDDLLEKIGRTLQSNNRVWFVGGVKILPPDRMAIVLPPAPNTEFGWSGDAYSESWSQQLGDFLRRRATSGQFVPISTPGPISELEDVPLFVAQGWRE